MFVASKVLLNPCLCLRGIVLGSQDMVTLEVPSFMLDFSGFNSPGMMKGPGIGFTRARPYWGQPRFPSIQEIIKQHSNNINVFSRVME